MLHRTAVLWDIVRCYERKRAAGLNELGKMLNSIELIAGLSDSLICKCASVISKKGPGEGRASQTYLLFSCCTDVLRKNTLEKCYARKEKLCF